MRSRATSVEQYLAALPVERRRALETVRAVILKNLDADYEEGMQYGMIGYHVPHSVYPAGYHCNPRHPLPFAGLASQKNYVSLYLMSLYGDSDELRRFERDWARSGKPLKMGKCCVRFRKLDDVSLEAIGQAIRRMPAKKYIAQYEAATGKAQPSRNVATSRERPEKVSRARRRKSRS